MTCADNARRGSLARLLATENLHIEHSTEAQTASFDLNSRTLTLPVWDRANPHTYDMLVGHEVGHALFTPNAEDGWCEAAAKIGGESGRRTAQTYLNIVEDARIERMIQGRYPGLRKDFFHGYRDIWAQGFFGVSDPRKVAASGFPDRLNLHFKIGSFVTVPFFNDAERDFVKRIGAALTWQEVVEISGDLFTYMKSPLPPDQPQNGNDEEDAEGEDWEDSTEDSFGDESEEGESFDGEESEDGSAVQTPQGEKTDGEAQDGEDSESQDGEDSENENSKSAKRNGTTREGDGEAVPEEAATDGALQRHLDRLNGPTSRGRIVHAYLPKPNIKNIVRDYTRVLSDIGYIADARGGSTGYDTWSAENRKTVELMAKSFELKKAAEATARTSIRRTGVLDTGSLHKYRFTEDIFRKSSFTQDGKNHGMILILDWSGSMSGQMLDTVKQLITLVGFCRRVSIPFEVYAFSDRHEIIEKNLSENGITVKNDPYECDGAIFGHQWIAQNGKVPVNVSPVALLNLFSSRMNRAETDKIAKSLFRMYDGTPHCTISRGYSLGGTPMNAALLAVREIAKSFRKATRVQILNTVVLTDGEASDSVNHPHFTDSKMRGEVLKWVNGCAPTIMVHDGESGRQWYGDSWAAQTQNVINCLRADAGTKVIQMMIGYARQNVQYAGEVAVRTWADEGFYETTKSNNPHGWDAAFVIKASATEVTMEELLAKRSADPAKSVTTANIKNAFIKQMKSRTSSRVLVNRLTDLIA